MLTDPGSGVLTLTISRPEKRNTIDGFVLAGLEVGLYRARRDNGLRMDVLRGAGGYFSAGIDLPFAASTNLTINAALRKNSAAIDHVLSKDPDSA